MLKNLKKALPQKIFFMFFAGIPLWFSFSFYPSYYEGFKTYDYQSYECVILLNKREKFSAEDYRQKLRYSYQYGGQDFVSSLYQHGMELQSNNWSYVNKSFRKKKAGEIIECYINPENPAESVIVQGPMAPWYQIILFSMLLIIGLWGFYMSFFRPQWAEENMKIDGDVT